MIKIEYFGLKFGPKTQERPEIRIFQGKNNPFNPQQSRKLKKYNFSDNQVQNTLRLSAKDT